MPENSKSTLSAENGSEPRRYYKLQVRAWINSDPSSMELDEIAEQIERGAGFLTAIEVIKVAENLTAIDDTEVRQSFENIAAAERILANVADLPKALRDQLFAALSAGEEENTRKVAA